MKKLGVAIAFMLMGWGSLAPAAVIDNGSYTTDTVLGLDYLDVGLINDTPGNFAAGVVYAGRTWVLATPTQIAQTWSAATGLSLTSADVMSSDNNMTFAAVNTLIGLFDGVTTDVGVSGERVIGNFPVAGYYNFIDGGMLAVHDVFDDSHFYVMSARESGAWLVSPTSDGSVPEPGTLGIFAVGLFGVGLVRKVRQTSPKTKV